MIPSFDVIVQNEYLPPGYLDGTGATNQAVMISGWMLAVPGNITPLEFMALTPDDVATAFKRHSPITDWDTRDIVILDVEPEWGRPQQWWQQSVGFYGQLKMICDTIRSLLPNCRLSLWGFFPPPVGEVTAAEWHKCQGEGYNTARRLGVYDSLSHLCVVMRSPHVPGDSGYVRTPRWLETGLNAASQFGLPMLAFVAFLNVNGSSVGFNKPYPLETLELQLDTIVQHGRCISCVIWAGAKADVNRTTVASLANRLE